MNKYEGINFEKELPEGPKYYPSDMISANPESFVKNSKLFYEIKTLPNLYI